MNRKTPQAATSLFAPYGGLHGRDLCAAPRGHTPTFHPLTLVTSPLFLHFDPPPSSPPSPEIFPSIFPQRPSSRAAGVRARQIRTGGPDPPPPSAPGGTTTSSTSHCRRPTRAAGCLLRFFYLLSPSSCCAARL
jgi:hypothetical protein